MEGFGFEPKRNHVLNGASCGRLCGLQRLGEFLHYGTNKGIFYRYHITHTPWPHVRNNHPCTPAVRNNHPCRKDTQLGEVEEVKLRLHFFFYFSDVLFHVVCFVMSLYVYLILWHQLWISAFPWMRTRSSENWATLGWEDSMDTLTDDPSEVALIVIICDTLQEDTNTLGLSCWVIAVKMQRRLASASDSSVFFPNRWCCHTQMCVLAIVFFWFVNKRGRPGNDPVLTGWKDFSPFWTHLLIDVTGSKCLVKWPPLSSAC